MRKPAKSHVRPKEAPLVAYRLLITTNGTLISEIQKVDNIDLNKAFKNLNIQTMDIINAIHKLALELINDTDRQVSEAAARNPPQKF